MRTVTWQGPQAKGRTTARPLVAVAAVILAFGTLSGCAPSPDPAHAPSSTAAPAPQPTPLFSSDEEALAAAKKAYAEYLRVSDEIAHDGGAHPERIRAVATGEALRDALKGFAEYREANAHSEGARRLDSVRLQSISLSTVAFYVCDDVADVRVVDSSGNSLVSPTRPPQSGFVISASTSTRASGLLISSRDPWEGNNLCT